MKKILFILSLVMCSVAVSAQTTNPFPTTDSLRKFINKWIRNSAVDAFTNLRLNTALIGVTRFIDSSDANGKLSISDTAAMLDGYTRLSRFMDSVAALRAAINTKASQSSLVDTAAAIRAASGTGNVTKAYVDSLDGYWKSSIIGSLWVDKFNRGSLGANYTENSPNSDIALTGTSMTFKSATLNSFTDYVEYVAQNYNWTHGSIDIGFKIDSIGPSNSGFGLGFQSQSTNPNNSNNTFQCRFLAFVSGSDTLGRLDFLSNGVALKTGSTAFPYSKNDSLMMRITRIDNTFYFTVRNLNRNGLNAELTESYTFPLSIGSYTYSPPNISRLRIYALGGNQTFYEFSASSHAKKYPQALFVGNSQSISIGATLNRNGYPFRTMREKDQFVIHGGGFERTEDAVLRTPDYELIKPKYIFVELGINDGGSGVSAATLQANIDTITVRGQRAGATVILSTVIPTMVNNTTEANYNAAILAVAASRGCTVVPAYNSALNDGSGGLAAPYDGGDDIHLSDAGAEYLASMIRKVLPIDSSYTNTIHVAKADTIPDGLWNFATLDKTTGRVGKLDVSRLGWQQVTNFGNSTTNSVNVQSLTTTTTANQFSVGYWGIASGGASNGFLMHNIRLNGGAFAHLATGGGALIQPFGGSILFNTISSGTGNVTAGQIKGNLRLDPNGDVFFGNMATSGTTNALTQMMSNGHWLWGMGTDNAYLNLNHTSFNLMDLNTSFANGGYIAWRQGNTIRAYTGFGSATTSGAALGDFSIRADTVHVSDMTGAKKFSFAGSEFRAGTDVAIDRGAYTIQNTGGFYQNGSAYLAGQNTGTNTMKLLVKGTDSLVYQIDPSSLASTPALTTNYIGYGVSGSLSGTSSYQFNGTTVTQEASGASNMVSNTAALGATSGGAFNAFTSLLPTASGQQMGVINFGNRNGATATNIGASIEALSVAAHTNGSSYASELRFNTTASGATTPTNRMRILHNGNIGIGTSPTARLHLPAGTATAGTAPLKLASGTNLTTAEAGAEEYDGTSRFFTPGSTRLRYTLTDNSIPSNGQIPIGNGTNYTNATLTGSSSVAVTNGSGSITLSIPSSYSTSGTYTPTVTGITNVDAVTLIGAQYSRVGDMVTVSGALSIDATAISTNTVVDIDLPIATSSGPIYGTINGAAAGAYGRILNNADKARVSIVLIDVNTNIGYTFIFQYRIQ